MILCPACNAPNLRPDQGCTACGFAPAKIDGFIAWAPELAKNSEGFREESFEGLARVEAGNFWFRSRNSVILWALRKYFPGFQSLLEVGCGTGFVLSGIAQAFPGTRISGSEIYTAGLAFAAQRLPTVELQQMDARKLPYQEEFDVVAAFDVIEHILEDELVLRNFHRAIKPGGGCLITVPQHPWLWSPVDEEACHQRRYTARELHAKVRDAGFRILRSSSFVTFLLPLMLASRLASRRSGTSGGTDSLQLNSMVDGALEACMRLEHRVIKAGVPLPIGGSRLVVLQKVPSA
ncbi:class I SAM-dependent methyltransferase [Variovorax saccharolyticus]|uniref:class I SAM-dependent methyltransferase n=1 Tax=Variovorax saccharolyticus TaxID=3053516 RepID=UPI002577CE6A|nr:class I SAM-dependent methyltransferase [Variovorax sp. J31P216]MDM0028697.1 class I SAM-dependent methyltransferase [Variovorax sp. J31P216]